MDAGLKWVKTGGLLIKPIISTGIVIGYNDKVAVGRSRVVYVIVDLMTL